MRPGRCGGCKGQPWREAPLSAPWELEEGAPQGGLGVMAGLPLLRNQGLPPPNPDLPLLLKNQPFWKPGPHSCASQPPAAGPSECPGRLPGEGATWALHLWGPRPSSPEPVPVRVCVCVCVVLTACWSTLELCPSSVTPHSCPHPGPGNCAHVTSCGRGVLQMELS